MKSVLKMELYKAFKNRYFLIAFLCSTGIAVYGAFRMASGYVKETVPFYDHAGNFIEPVKTATVYTKWLGGNFEGAYSNLFYFLLFLLCTIPYGWSLISEKKSGYIKNPLVRSKKGIYYFSKYIASFISGGFVIAAALTINFIICACFVPAHLPDLWNEISFGVPPDYVWADFYFSQPLLYAFLYVLLGSIFGGLWSTICLTISFIFRKSFVVMVFPYLAILFFNYISHSELFLAAPRLEFSPMYFIIPRQMTLSNSLAVIAVWIAGILLFDFAVVYFKGMRKDVI